MFLRIWVLGHEILSIHFTSLEPVFETGTEQLSYDDMEEPAGLAWTVPDPDDGSHLIWHPEAEASDAEG